MIDLFSELLGMFDDFDGVFTANTPAKENRVCPVCGHSWEDFNRTGKFGCSECYKTFYGGAEQVLRRVHSTAQHNGKIPSKSGAEVRAKRQLENLKAQLKTAVANEEYETAAKLHAQIKEIEGGGVK